MATSSDDSYQATEEGSQPVDPSNIPFAVDEGRNRAQSKAEAVMEKLGGEIPVILIGSVMVMACAADLCVDLVDLGGKCEKEFAFAVSAGTISTIVCLAFVLLSRFQPQALPEKTLSALGLFLFVWWTVSVAVLTFDIPFNNFANANGYIGTWLCFVMSTRLCVSNNPFAASHFGNVASNVTADARGAAFTLLVLAGVMLGASIKPATNGGTSGDEIWAIVNSSITIVCALLAVLLADKIGDKMKFLSAFLALWCIGGAFTTFFGPFKAAGNGYFSAIGCMISAMYLFNAYSS